MHDLGFICHGITKRVIKQCFDSSFPPFDHTLDPIPCFTEIMAKVSSENNSPYNVSKNYLVG